MKLGRRGFLKLAGASVLAVVSAPVFIPAERLDLGVPTGRLLAPPSRIVTPDLRVLGMYAELLRGPQNYYQMASFSKAAGVHGDLLPPFAPAIPPGLVVEPGVSEPFSFSDIKIETYAWVMDGPLPPSSGIAPAVARAVQERLLDDLDAQIAGLLIYGPASLPFPKPEPFLPRPSMLKRRPSEP